MTGRAAGRWLARLLPRALREEYGAEFVTLVEERLAEEARNGGRAAAWRYRLRVLADVLGTAWRSGLGDVRSVRRSRTRGLEAGARPSGPVGVGPPGSAAPNPPGGHVPSWPGVLLHDLRYGSRQLWRHPGFTAAVVLTLSLGIGVNAAVFNVVNAQLFRPPPVDDPDSLVLLRQTNADRPDRLNRFFSYPDYLDYRDRTEVFSGLAATRVTNSYISGGSHPEQLFAEQVSGNYFAVLGVRPRLGRMLRPSDDDPAAEAVAVISHALWQRQFGGDPGVIGAQFVLNGGDPFTIVGVAPEGSWPVVYSSMTDIWYPLAMRTRLLHTDAQRRSDPHAQRQARRFMVFGRLGPGVGLQQAQAAISALAEALARTYPDTNEGRGIVLSRGIKLPPEQRAVFVRWSLAALGGAGIVLLIACVNISGMLLARSLDRSREIAIRRSIGAGRGRLLSLLMSENLVLAGTAGVGGLVLAQWASRALAGTLPLQYQPTVDMGLDLRVAGFTFLVSALAVLLFGLMPAWRLSGRWFSATSGSLRPGARGLDLEGTRKTLLVAQVAVSVVLLAGAGLFLRSLRGFNTPDLGFDPNHVLRAIVQAGPFGYESEEEVAIIRQLGQRVATLNGVRSVSIGDLPYTTGLGGIRVWPLDRGPVDDEAAGQVAFQTGATGYHRTLGIPIVRGREFGEQDARSRSEVVIISESMARQLWPDEDPLGAEVALLPAPPLLTERRNARVIGISADTAAVTPGRHAGWVVDDDPGRLPPRPAITLPLWMTTPPSAWVYLWVRSDGPPTSLVPALREELQAIDPELVPLTDTLAELWADMTTYERTYATFAGLLGLLAAGLCAVGLYGAMAHEVSRKTHDIGVRMALGARQSHLVGAVLRQGLLPALGGLVLGVAGALALYRVIASLLHEVRPTDPLTYAAVAAMVIGVALVASWAPARRAVRVDPIEALRSE